MDAAADAAGDFPELVRLEIGRLDAVEPPAAAPQLVADAQAGGGLSRVDRDDVVLGSKAGVVSRPSVPPSIGEGCRTFLVPFRCSSTLFSSQRHEHVVHFLSVGRGCYFVSLTLAGFRGAACKVLEATVLTAIPLPGSPLAVADLGGRISGQD